MLAAGLPVAAADIDYGKPGEPVKLVIGHPSQRPDVVKGWLNAELDAQLFLSDPRNAQEVMRWVKTYTAGMEDKYLWAALYGAYPPDQGGTPRRLMFPFLISPHAHTLIDKATTFLHSIKGIHVSKLRPEAVMGEFAQQVLAERKLTSPIGSVSALPDAASK
jgi:NitT/TauT family transport system substrate-binding protein